jgi:hypothetical protein
MIATATLSTLNRSARGRSNVWGYGGLAEHSGLEAALGGLLNGEDDLADCHREPIVAIERIRVTATPESASFGLG